MRPSGGIASSPLPGVPGGRLWGFGLLVLTVVVTHAAPGLALQSEYRDLQEAFQEGDLPDSSALVTLPLPRTAREFWLRSRIQPDFSRAREDLAEAIELSDDPAVRSRFLKEWIQLSLLSDEDGGEPDLAFLEDQFDSLQNEGHSPGRLWLLGARFARAEGDRDRARSWLERAVEADETKVRQSARLNLAELTLRAGNLDRTRAVLDDYFLEASEGTDPEYWLLRGRLFEREGADSEAYVAYSHILNEYPRSMVLRAAERRINALPVATVVTDTPSPAGQDASGTSPSAGTADPDPESGFRLQVGSFRSRSQAVDLRDRVAEILEQRVVVRRARVEGRTYHRVQVLGFSSRDEAVRGRKRIEEHGFDGFVIQP